MSTVHSISFFISMLKPPSFKNIRDKQIQNPKKNSKREPEGNPITKIQYLRSFNESLITYKCANEFRLYNMNIIILLLKYDHYTIN